MRLLTERIRKEHKVVDNFTPFMLSGSSNGRFPAVQRNKFNIRLLCACHRTVALTPNKNILALCGVWLTAHAGFRSSGFSLVNYPIRHLQTRRFGSDFNDVVVACTPRGRRLSVMALTEKRHYDIINAHVAYVWLLNKKSRTNHLWMNEWMNKWFDLINVL